MRPEPLSQGGPLTMPQAMARACTTYRCGNTQPCPDHAKVATQQRDQQRDTAHQRGYTRQWQDASRLFLKRYPVCGMRRGDQPPVMSRCYEQGRITPAGQVDHVVPHKGNKRLFWDKSNWQSLCRQCGARKSQAGL